jgi:peptidoglycan/xylan/chitin deacetylase (PgdA/CDA1 family)
VTRTWLTVDTDDRHHRPSMQGHPTRSASPDGRGVDRTPSEAWLSACSALGAWLDRQSVPVTLFVIADQLEVDASRDALLSLTNRPGVTVGCHGLHHRAWGAWPADELRFNDALTTSMHRLREAFGDRVQPWFRAPSGYVAPWMARVLAGVGMTVDSSVNPSFLVRKKAGPGRSWTDVERAMTDAGLVERPWLVRKGLPTCGPALHLPLLRRNARRAWRALPDVLKAEEVPVVEDASRPLVTVYWHLDDHARHHGAWTPPLR